MINITKINNDMDLIALNFFEIFSLFDLVNKGNQIINETI
jgi:hypothetical protein